MVRLRSYCTHPTKRLQKVPSKLPIRNCRAKRHPERLRRQQQLGRLSRGAHAGRARRQGSLAGTRAIAALPSRPMARSMLPWGRTSGCGDERDGKQKCPRPTDWPQPKPRSTIGLSWCRATDAIAGAQHAARPGRHRRLRRRRGDERARLGIERTDRCQRRRLVSGPPPAKPAGRLGVPGGRRNSIARSYWSMPR